METNVTPVSAPADAGQVSAEGSQTATTATQTESGAQVAPATQPVKQPQSQEENAIAKALRVKYEAQLKAAETKAAEAQARADKIAATGWGEAGVKTAADWEAMQRREQVIQQYGVDPEAVKPLIQQELEKHPDVVAAREYRHEFALKSEAEIIAKDLPELNIKDSEGLRELLQSDEAIGALVAQNVPPSAAIWAVKGREIVQQREAKAREDAKQETIKNLQQNAAASPGSLGQGADAPLTISEEELSKGLDPVRLRKDPAYLKAALEANAARLKKK